MKKIVISILIILLVGIIVISIINIDTTKAATTTLADKIISLSQGTSWNAGASGVYQTNGHEYRYVGGEVNNYVSFNNDMYQIIGVFDSNSTGVNANLVKLIRANPIGSYSWGVHNAPTAYTTYSTYNNNWVSSNAYVLLNEYFLNATDTSTTYGQCANWTYHYYYGSNAYKTKDCTKIIKYGIQTETLRNYIQPVTWYLKGYGSSSYSKQNFYTCERSDAATITSCNSGNSGAYATKVENKSIGLMYASDYLYASGYYASTSTTNASSYDYGKQNWLYNGYEWTITPRYDKSDIAFYVYNGHVYYAGITHYPYAIRPTFYLKANVMYESGTGSFSDPYTISCDTCNS